MNLDLIHHSELSNQPVLQRVLAAKRAYTTRRVPLLSMSRLESGADVQPRAGDLMLARVVRIGKHAHLEGTDSRRATLFVGDEIVVACGARYAPDQFDARLPASLGPCHLAAGGGVAGVVVARRDGIGAPTELQPIGLLTDEHGLVANVGDHALRTAALQPARRPVTIVSLGTSMNAGKTTSAAYLIRGLTRSGLRVGAAKVTGTGSGNDPGLFRDAGAVRVADFTDAGFASTCNVAVDVLTAAAHRLVAHLAEAKVQAVVLEVADGLFQRETAGLLRTGAFRDLVDATLFSSGDAMGACSGSDWLSAAGLAPLALTGAMTRSPLAAREAADASGLPVLGLDDLSDPDTARRLWVQAASKRTSGLAA